jgi:MOSC domain-containing protein YiiM
MFEGKVISISIAGEMGAPMQDLQEVRALAGRGLEGDRYLDAEHGTQATLIAAEAIDAMAEEAGYAITYSEARRNIVTRDVPLNDLLDKEFKVGEVMMRGIRLSEPCEHLASLTDQRILRGLVHRAGLKAEILNDGVIRVGDPVRQVLAATTAR